MFSMAGKSLIFWLLIGVLALAVIQSLGIGMLFFFKKSGVKKANYFYGILLITFGLTLIHNILYVTNFFEKWPEVSFLPIYYTLAFPTFLFYYVKLNLYPSYQMKWTDIKHFILPISQFSFFVYLCFYWDDYNSPLNRYFYSPFYGAIEQALYLISFFAYMYFSYRYIRQKNKELKNKTEARKVMYMKILIQTLFFLFCIHTLFIIVDFVSFDFFNINLRTIKPFTALGILSFAALAYWLNVYGFQVLIWGRRLFRN